MTTARHGRLEAHECAARRIQRVFRGWRTRRRVVWAVRADLEAFMREMEADVEMERLLLALPKPQRHGWPEDGSTLLRLPRIQDDVFGWVSSFPDAPSDCERADADAGLSGDGEGVGGEAGEDTNIHHNDECSVVSPTSALAVSLEDEEDCTSEEPTHAGGESEASSHEELLVEEEGDHALQAHHDEMEHEEPIAPSESDLSESGKNETNSMVTVEHILATHSRAGIELELEWTRQALRDRLRYLRSRTK